MAFESIAESPAKTGEYVRSEIQRWAKVSKHLWHDSLISTAPIESRKMTVQKKTKGEVRRIITGHDQNGLAYVTEDRIAPSVHTQP